MAVSNIKATFPCDVKTVWDIVTSLYKISWRSDLSKITLFSENQFIEHTKKDFQTKFQVTCREEYRRWEFDMDNKNIKGHWTGIFSKEGEDALLDFTEEVEAKKFFLKPFLKGYLKKQQEQYIEDLRKEVERVKKERLAAENNGIGKKGEKVKEAMEEMKKEVRELKAEQVRTIVERIKEKTKRKAYKLELNIEKQPGIFDSKFGGLPYWDGAKEYPVDDKGQKMLMLAQINLKGLPRLCNEDGLELPEEGLLQFFCGADDCYGLDFDTADSQKTYRVIYHKTIDPAVTEEKVKAMGIPASTDEDMEEYTPVFVASAVDISVEDVYMGLSDYRFDEMFLSDAHSLYQVNTEGVSAYNLISEECYDDMSEELSQGGHWLLAYPFFTQDDPREYKEELRVYDTMLFQMDSDMQEEDYVLWGDCGVGNFFIQAEALRRADFSRVLYNWDCC